MKTFNKILPFKLIEHLQYFDDSIINIFKFVILLQNEVIWIVFYVLFVCIQI